LSYIGNPVNSTQFTTDTFTGDGTTVSFTLSRIPATETAIGVYVNGVKKVSSGAGFEYTLAGNVLTFTGAPALSAKIEVVHFGITLTLNAVADGSVTANSLSTVLRDVIANQFTANGTGTTFQLGADPLSANAIVVTANGVVQYDYSVSGSTLILNFTPANGTLIRAAGFGNILSAGTVANDSISTAKIQNNAVTTAKLSVTGVTSGTYGGAEQIPVIVIGVDGRITSSANVSVSAPLPNILMLSGM
jgi:hypothetical protein